MTYLEHYTKLHGGEVRKEVQELLEEWEKERIEADKQGRAKLQAILDEKE